MAKFLTTEGLQTLITKIKSVEGDLNQLTTGEKTNLVAAINEINAKQPADSEDIQALLTLVGNPSGTDTPASGLYAKFENLDAEISQTATDSNPLNLSITQVDGAITAISGSIADNFFATKEDLQAIQGLEELTPEQLTALTNINSLVPNSRKIAGIDLTDDISADELLSAIELSIHESEEEGCIAVGERDVPVHGLGELAFAQGLTIEVDNESVIFNQVVDAENEEEESTAYNFTIEIATAEDIEALFD